MPKTFEMIKRINDIDICALVNLNPKTMLIRHSHPYIEEYWSVKTSFIISNSPNDNYINCNGEFIQHLEGVPIYI
ncbi:hypothetical protein [Tenacibaculum dicentrarchi]